MKIKISDYMNNFFNFEEKDLDFPFYNGKPQLKSTDWIILLAALILRIAFIFGLWNYIPFTAYLNPLIIGIIELLLLFIPIAYCCRGNLGLFLRKPEKKDLKVIIICVILYYVFSIAMALILRAVGVATATNPIGSMNASLPLVLILVLILLFGEELFKFSTLIMSMAVAYRFTDDRKTSMIIGIIVSCILFGLIHLGTYQFNVLQCLLIIGIGCVIHFYPYLKTKNLTNSYITHIIIDLIVIIPVFLIGLG